MGGGVSSCRLRTAVSLFLERGNHRHFFQHMVASHDCVTTYVTKCYHPGQKMFWYLEKSSEVSVYELKFFAYSSGRIKGGESHFKKYGCFALKRTKFCNHV